jgi:hypothetical protein
MHKTRGSKTPSSSQSPEKSKENITDDIPPMDDESQHPSNIKLKTYWVLVVLRFFLAIVPQNGYIQPDEFFQSVEVVAGNKKLFHSFNLTLKISFKNTSLLLLKNIVIYSRVGTFMFRF